MFGKAPSTIRAACWERGLPYPLGTTWGPGGRRFRRMVFSMREISALLDHYAPARQPGPRGCGEMAAIRITRRLGRRLDARDSVLGTGSCPDPHGIACGASHP